MQEIQKIWRLANIRYWKSHHRYNWISYKFKTKKFRSKSKNIQGEIQQNQEEIKNLSPISVTEKSQDRSHISSEQKSSGRNPKTFVNIC